MKLRCAHTEYGNVYNSADAECTSDMHWVLLELMRSDTPDRWRPEAIEWLREVEPKIQSLVGTPLVHGAWHLRQWWSGLRKLKKYNDSFTYVQGKAHPIDLIPAQLQSIFKEGLRGHKLWTVPTNYYSVAAGYTRGAFCGRFADRGDATDLLEKVAKKQEVGYDYHVAEVRPWLPFAARPDLAEAHDYADECNRLQATPAGRKAKRLLLDSLSEAQAEDYMRRGYFFVVPRGLNSNYRYVIERGFPNGNIMKLRCLKDIKGRQRLFPDDCYCFHSKDPHPLDDILLTQKLIIETDEEGFLKEANRSDPYHRRWPFQASLRGY